MAVRTIVLTLLAAGGMILAGPAEGGERDPLAVVGFRVRGMEGGEHLGEALAEVFSVKLGPYFRVIERVQVAKIIETRRFETTDLVEDTGKAAEVGKLVRARFIMVGSLTRIGSDYLLVAKILRCDTGEQHKGGSAILKNIGQLSVGADTVIRSMGLKAEAPGDEPPPPPSGFVIVRPGLYRCERDRALMVFVPPGKFLMGSEGIGPAERPLHEARMKGFLIDRTEVTNRMFARFLNTWGKDVDTFSRPMIYPDPNIGLLKRGDTWSPVKGHEDHPVVRVTWFGAGAYAKWAGKQLPTEAQWEYAARGSDKRGFPWGNAKPSGGLAVFGRRPPDRTGKCGILKDGASPFGCMDMAGNVNEWCRDWYDPEFYEVSPFKDPRNLEEKDHRVVRGGSWYDPPNGMDSARRGHKKPIFAEDTLGFRCVKTFD